MGQRHQQFIRTLNPQKYGYHPEGFDLFTKRNKTVVLPFHNQWLYGRSAPLSALRVLEHAAAIPVASRTGVKDSWSGDTSPFGLGGLQYHTFKKFDKYISAVEFILNYTPKGEYGVTNPGMGGSFFLGGKEYYTMSKDFTMGDNNDGITIIDTTTLKYCFMNIYSYDDEIGQSASDLPVLQPVSALDYMAAYYPMGIDKFSEYSKEDSTPEELREEATKNAEINNKIAARFEPFKVMTLDEVKKIFPRVYEAKEAIK